jgi:sugar phosphate isomerase/epimerase
MKTQTTKNRLLSRRKFLGTAATAAATIAILPVSSSCKSSSSRVTAISKLNSKFKGVQIGVISYSFRDMGSNMETTLKACVDSGCSSIELMSTGIEEYLGAPSAPPRPPRAPQPQGPAPAGASAGRSADGSQSVPSASEQKAAMDKYNSDLKAWRLSVPLTKYEELRKKFNDAGVDIHIVKFSPSRWSDEEIEYAFKAAKALGAKGITEEIGEEAVNKLGPIAAKHGMYAIFHQHMQFATEGFSYDPFLAVSPAVMMNFDAGHFFGSTGIHPNTIIEKYHDRIFSIHLKDKTGPNATPPNTNQVWGQGEMPIADVLNLIKEKKYPIYCDIELEYTIAPWSTSVKEVKTCCNYARQILI